MAELFTVETQPTSLFGEKGIGAAAATDLAIPFGLEYLSQLNQLIVKQQYHAVEVFFGWEKQNKYDVSNSMGQQVFTVLEDTSCAQRQFCKNARGFVLHVHDSIHQEVLRFSRVFKCCAGCCWCADGGHCSLTIQVETGAGEILGYVQQRKSSWKPHYAIYTGAMDLVGVIHGPCCVCNCGCCGDVQFPVYGTDEETVIGQVAKQWSGAAREIFTDADIFSVTFPLDMDIRMKATMFGALFLVDFMYFEK